MAGSKEFLLTCVDAGLGRRSNEPSSAPLLRAAGLALLLLTVVACRTDERCSFESADASGRCAHPDLGGAYVAITSGPNAITTNPHAEFTFSLEGGNKDAQASVYYKCSLDWSRFQRCTSPKTYDASEDDHTFRVIALVGDHEVTVGTVWQWAVDTKPPETQIWRSYDPSQEIATFNAGCSDSGCTYECSLDDGPPQRCVPPLSFPDLNPGIHRLSVAAVDRAGHFDATPATVEWVIWPEDLRPVISSAQPSLTHAMGASFSFGVPGFESAEGLQFQCSLDANDFSPCESPQHYDHLADGEHLFRVATIVEGHQSSWEPSDWRWFIDTQEPETTLAPEMVISAGSASLSFACSKPPCSFRCRIDGEAETACNSPFAISNPSPGKHAFSVAAIDAIGNADSTPALRTWQGQVGAPDSEPSHLTVMIPSMANATPRVAHISWQTSISPVSSWNVQRRESATQPWQTVATVPPEARYFVDRGLQPDSSLRYRVWASLSSGERVGTGEMSVRTCSDVVVNGKLVGLPAEMPFPPWRPYPACSYAWGEVRVPVVMIDFSDFEPNNPEYKKIAPEELEAYLNGPTGPGAYFREVSGQQLRVIFDVYGWVRSGQAGGRLQNLAYYRKNETLPGACNVPNIARSDAYADAIASMNLIPERYDSDMNGIVDGVVVVYEGDDATPPCKNKFVGEIEGSGLTGLAGTATLAAVLSEKVGPDFLGSAVWEHEVGHFLMGYPDNYFRQQDIAYYMLSGDGYSAYNYGSNDVFYKQPSALEKYLYARWLPVDETNFIRANGEYSIRTNELSDGDMLQGDELRIIPLNDDESRFIALEHRWIVGNPKSRYAGGRPSYEFRSNGLQIYEVDLNLSPYPDDLATYPVKRMLPPGGIMSAFHAGQSFHQCFSGKDITVEPLESDEKARNRFRVTFGTCAWIR